MRKVTYFGAKLRRVVNRSPGQGTRHCQTVAGGCRGGGKRHRDVAYIKQLLAHCILAQAQAHAQATASKGSQMEPQAKRKMRASKKRDPPPEQEEEEAGDRGAGQAR